MFIFFFALPSLQLRYKFNDKKAVEVIPWLAGKSEKLISIEL
jgi:hypothetical protein